MIDAHISVTRSSYSLDFPVRVRVRVSSYRLVARVILKFWRQYLRELAVMASMTYREMRW